MPDSNHSCGRRLPEESVVKDYSTIMWWLWYVDGKVLHQATCRGFSDNSAWARWQAWLFIQWLIVKRRILIFGNSRTYGGLLAQPSESSEDGVPYWDFNAGQEGYVPIELWSRPFQSSSRDASAAAIAASAFNWLRTYQWRYVLRCGCSTKSLSSGHQGTALTITYSDA